jgi:hypothetical protein
MQHAKQHRPAPAPKLAPPRPQAAGVHAQHAQHAPASPTQAKSLTPSASASPTTSQLKLDPTALASAMQISETARQQAVTAKTENKPAQAKAGRTSGKADATKPSKAPTTPAASQQKAAPTAQVKPTAQA